MKNYSKQREVILNVLHSTNTHPTVSWIYSQARKTLPNISLGTVYRNLTELKKSGQIIEVSVEDGFQHFDGNTDTHLHFYCTKCQTIYDCACPENQLKNYLEENLGCNITEQKLIFNGVCKNCSVNI